MKLALVARALSAAEFLARLASAIESLPSAAKARGSAAIAENIDGLLCIADWTLALSLPWLASAEAVAAELNAWAAIAACASALPFLPKLENAAWLLAIAFAATALLFRAERFADKARKALAFAPRAEKAEALFAASADIAFASCARFENAAAFARIAGSVPFSAAS